MAEQIAERLLSALAATEGNGTDHLAAKQVQEWSDELEKDLLSADSIPKFNEDPSNSSLLLNNAANKLHASLLATVDSALIDADGWSTDEDAAAASNQ
jgi:hypothetical protein